MKTAIVILICMVSISAGALDDIHRWADSMTAVIARVPVVEGGKLELIKEYSTKQIEYIDANVVQMWMNPGDDPKQNKLLIEQVWKVLHAEAVHFQINQLRVMTISPESEIIQILKSCNEYCETYSTAIKDMMKTAVH